MPREGRRGGKDFFSHEEWGGRDFFCQKKWGGKDFFCQKKWGAETRSSQNRIYNNLNNFNYYYSELK